MTTYRVRRRKKQVSIRGLNKDHNHDLKGLFKAAATRASVPARTIPGFLPAIAGQRHQADHGTPHAGTQDCSHYADSMEEGGKFRRCETEVASRLSVSGEAPLPSPAIFFWWWSVGS